jgi:hypothetical protein
MEKAQGQELQTKEVKKRQPTLAETFIGCRGCQEINCNTASRSSCYLKQRLAETREERVIVELTTNPKRLNLAC